MFVDETVKTYYQMLARQCGCWSAAHFMRKRGFTLEQCHEALDDLRYCTRVWASRATGHACVADEISRGGIETAA